jgi:hypothetical protein
LTAETCKNNFSSDWCSIRRGACQTPRVMEMVCATLASSFIMKGPEKAGGKGVLAGA